MTSDPKNKPPPSDATRMAVLVCSVGRPDHLRFLVARLNRQSRLPDRIVLIVTRPEDAPAGGLPARDAEAASPTPGGPAAPGATDAHEIALDPAGVGFAGRPAVVPEVLIAPKGLPRQRNAGLARVEADCDIVVFFDDDFVPGGDALAGIEAAFAALPDVNGMTGLLIADGIGGPGFTPQAAALRVDDWDAARPVSQSRPQPVTLDRPGLYGCNMAYRAAAIRGLRFDERLPLYAWQEDIDFAARVPGRRVFTDAFAGVHCGAKSGRETAGRRLGYSQMVNPFYLWRKGTMTGGFALRIGLRNFAANHIYAMRPEPWIDRIGRARGNWIGLVDIARGRADPERILLL